MNHAVFLINLNQDVAVSRPVARLFHREESFGIIFLVTSKFRERDASGLWFQEIEEIARELHGQVFEVVDVSDAICCLDDKSGLLISASESSLNAHRFTHDVFLAAPRTFTRITLQHGLECIGFNHNEAHNRNWSHFIGMGCDVAASWFDIGSLHSVRSDQRSKVIAVGPPFGIESPPAAERISRRRHPDRQMHGLICENLHSVRFNNGDQKSFIACFNAFARELEPKGGTIELRPHPGGRFFEKNKISLPANVRLNRLPLYKQALEKFSFGISAPSTVVFDMIWAGIPVAVWGNPQDADLEIFSKLHLVSDESQWLAFAEAASCNPEEFVRVQETFLASLNLPTDIAGRYRELCHLVNRRP